MGGFVKIGLPRLKMVCLPKTVTNSSRTRINPVPLSEFFIPTSTTETTEIIRTILSFVYKASIGIRKLEWLSSQDIGDHHTAVTGCMKTSNLGLIIG